VLAAVEPATHEGRPSGGRFGSGVGDGGDGAGRAFMSAKREARPRRIRMRVRPHDLGSRFIRVRRLRMALPRAERETRKRSLPFDRLGRRSVAQYAMPARTVAGLVAHEFQAPARGRFSTQRASRDDGLRERLRYSPSSTRVAVLAAARRTLRRSTRPDAAARLRNPSAWPARAPWLDEYVNGDPTNPPASAGVGAASSAPRTAADNSSDRDRMWKVPPCACVRRGPVRVSANRAPAAEFAAHSYGPLRSEA
jgi:hypothetical protein